MELIEIVRDILSKHGRLQVGAETIETEQDLYGVGLTSLATVSLMLAIEEHFDIEFPDAMLSRQTFASMAAIAEAVSDLIED